MVRRCPCQQKQQQEQEHSLVKRRKSKNTLTAVRQLVPIAPAVLWVLVSVLVSVSVTAQAAAAGACSSASIFHPYQQRQQLRQHQHDDPFLSFFTSSSSSLTSASRRQQQQQQQRRRRSVSRHTHIHPVWLTAKSRGTKPKSTNTNSNSNADSLFGATTTTTNGNQQDQVSTGDYTDLTVFGKVVAGATEFALVIIFDYLSGFATGYGLGSLWGFPELLFKKGAGGATPAAAAGAAFTQRVATWHGRSRRWGSSWGSISAVAGGSNVGARVLRGGVEDEWTSVLSSMAMGAFWRRKEGPMAMLQGAIMYGAIIYFISGNGRPESRKSASQMQQQQQQNDPFFDVTMPEKVGQF